MKGASTAKHAGLYALFTALPLAAVILALQIGRDLRPTTSIAGHWRADVETSIAAAGACRPGWGEDHPVMEVTQAGSHVELDFTEVRLRLVGVVAGGGVEASGRRGDVIVTLTGRIGGAQDQLVLHGTLRFGCPYPLFVSLRARKAP